MNIVNFLDVNGTVNATVVDQLTGTANIISPLPPSQRGEVGLNVTDIVFIAFSCLTVMSNALVIVTITWSANLRQKTMNIFIVNQSFVDLMAAVFILAHEENCSEQQSNCWKHRR